ncbi:MAG: hypothetical protein LBJ70_02395 [Holosporales bacterium]|nr:hypothetical protein [Holosporales bacterium]
MRRKVFEDARRVCYTSSSTGLFIQSFKDPLCEDSAGGGALDARISGRLMECLNRVGIETHFVRQLNMREFLVKEAEILPVSIVSHTVVSEELASRFQGKEGDVLVRPLLEFYYHKVSANGQEVPVPIGEDHVRSFSWMTEDDLRDVISCSLRAHDFLSGFFMAMGMVLCDLHLRFGRFTDLETDTSRVLVVDSLLPEAFCLKDAETNASISELSLCQEKLLPMEQKKRIGERMGILDVRNPVEKRRNTWFGLFRKESREG